MLSVWGGLSALEPLYLCRAPRPLGWADMVARLWRFEISHTRSRFGGLDAWKGTEILVLAIVPECLGLVGHWAVVGGRILAMWVARGGEDMDISADDLSIGTLIQTVTRELLDSQADREASGTPAVFQVKDLTLEISFVATNSKKAGGGFDLKVVKADAGVQYDQQSIHKITLTLVAPDEERPFGAGPVRPRRV